MQDTNDISDYVNKQMLLMVKALEHGFLLNYVKSSNLNPILKSITDEILDQVNKKIVKIDKNINQVNTKFNQIIDKDLKLDDVIDNLNKKMKSLESKIDRQSAIITDITDKLENIKEKQLPDYYSEFKASEASIKARCDMITDTLPNIIGTELGNVVGNVSYSNYHIPLSMCDSNMVLQYQA